MNILFVSGSDAAFFNSLLICLQSVAGRMPGQRMLVCDFGLTGAQAEFLRDLDLLLPRPPTLAPGAFQCKAALLSYLRHSGYDIDDNNAVVWLDADLTLMRVRGADFRAVAAAMVAAGAGTAVCRDPEGRTIGQMLSVPNRAAMAPFAAVVAEAAVDPGLPYVSTGLFICRSVALLGHWQQLTQKVSVHPLFEQNMFNVALRRDRTSFVGLDCEEWQAQAQSLDHVRIVQRPAGGRPAARIGEKNIKTLHTTSGTQRHLLIGICRLTVRDLDLIGPFKLLFAEPLRIYQLQLLASFVAEHREALLRLGLCTPSVRPVAGFEFATLDVT